MFGISKFDIWTNKKMQNDITSVQRTAMLIPLMRKSKITNDLQ